MTIGDRIKERRSELGLTLRQVADDLGVSEATMQRYESGKIKNLPQDRFTKLAAILHTSCSWLRGEDEETPSEKHTVAFELTVSEQIVITAYRKMDEKQRSALRTLLSIHDTCKDREHELEMKLKYAEDFIDEIGERSSYDAMLEELSTESED